MVVCVVLVCGPDVSRSFLVLVESHIHPETSDSSQSLTAAFQNVEK